MSISLGEKVIKMAAGKFLSGQTIWIGLGWGLCAVVLLGFSPLLFHLQEYVFFTLLIVGILVCLCQEKSLFVRNPIMLPFWGFIGWVALTIPFSIDPWVSLREWQKTAAIPFVFYGTCLIVREQGVGPFEKKIMTAMMVATLFCYSYSLFDFWARGGDWSDRTIRAGFPRKNEADFTWLSTNALMILPVLSAGFLLIESTAGRLMAGVSIFLGVLGLVFSYTRGVWLAFVVQAAIAAWVLNRRIWLWSLGGGLIAVVGLALVLVPTDLHRDTLDTWTVKSRLAVWNMGVSDVLKHPLTGVGYGVAIFEKRHSREIARLEATETGIPEIPVKPHNWYLMVAMGSGIPAFVLFAWLLVRIGTTLWDGFRSVDTPRGKFWILGILLMVAGLSFRILFDDSFGGSHAYLFSILVALGVTTIQLRTKHLQPTPNIG